MREVKETHRALVRIGYDGKVHKTFKGYKALERFTNELKVLKFLEKTECPFVPRALDSDAERLYLVTTNCGKPVEQISEKKMRQLFFELEQYGVRHNDPFARNVTYDPYKGRFCLIDFEFATILGTGEGLTLADTERKGCLD